VIRRTWLSGWQYDSWRSDFTPVEVPERRWLGYAAERFSTVEVDGSSSSTGSCATACGGGRTVGGEPRLLDRPGQIVSDSPGRRTTSEPDGSTASRRRPVCMS
jgi:hypothetical protein